MVDEEHQTAKQVAAIGAKIDAALPATAPAAVAATPAPSTNAKPAAAAAAAVAAAAATATAGSAVVTVPERYRAVFGGDPAALNAFEPITPELAREVARVIGTYDSRMWTLREPKGATAASAVYRMLLTTSSVFGNTPRARRPNDAPLMKRAFTATSEGGEGKFYCRLITNPNTRSDASGVPKFVDGRHVIVCARGPFSDTEDPVDGGADDCEVVVITASAYTMSDVAAVMKTQPLLPDEEPQSAGLLQFLFKEFAV